MVLTEDRRYAILYFMVFEPGGNGFVDREDLERALHLLAGCSNRESDHD